MVLLGWYRGEHKALGGLEWAVSLWAAFLDPSCCQSLKGEEETEPWKNWDFLR